MAGCKRKERGEGKNSVAECTEPTELRMQRAKFTLAKGCISTWRKSGGDSWGRRQNFLKLEIFLIKFQVLELTGHPAPSLAALPFLFYMVRSLDFVLCGSFMDILGLNCFCYCCGFYQGRSIFLFCESSFSTAHHSA